MTIGNKLTSEGGSSMITGSQCRAGRALLEVSRAKLARRAGVDEATIEQFEQNMGRPASDEIKSIQNALGSGLN